MVVGELHRLPHLPELPARGIGADMIGRAGALLVDIAIDTAPRGYRIVARPGAVARRAASLLAEDMDAFEEAWELAGVAGDRVVKVQAPGPVTLAAQLELSNGHRALTDLGAVRDLAASLAEGVAVHRSELARRLGATVVVQYDEPSLFSAVEGRLPGVTSLSPVHPVEENVAIALIDECVAAAAGNALLHVCGGDLPWKVLQRSTIAGISVDPSRLTDADLDGLGQFLDSGRAVVLGLLPSTAPGRRLSLEEIAAAAAAVTDRIGFSRAVLGDRIGISPVCGLAGATDKWARGALELAQQAADGLALDPEAI